MKQISNHMAPGTRVCQTVSLSLQGLHVTKLFRTPAFNSHKENFIQPKHPCLHACACWKLDSRVRMLWWTWPWNPRNRAHNNQSSSPSYIVHTKVLLHFAANTLIFNIFTCSIPLNAANVTNSNMFVKAVENKTKNCQIHLPKFQWPILQSTLYWKSQCTTNCLQNEIHINEHNIFCIWMKQEWLILECDMH
jgi:hypothetical protein